MIWPAQCSLKKMYKILRNSRKNIVIEQFIIVQFDELVYQLLEWKYSTCIIYPYYIGLHNIYLFKIRGKHNNDVSL